MKMVAEGVSTTGAALALGAQLRRRAADRHADGGSARRPHRRPHGDRRADAAQAACGGRNGATRRRGDGVIDRRKFLAGGLGATLLASFPADLWADTVQAAAPATGIPDGSCTCSRPSATPRCSSKRRFAAADERTDAANRGVERSRARDRHTTSVLAVPCDRPDPGPPIHAVAAAADGTRVVRAVGPWRRFRPSTRGRSGAGCCSSAVPADTSACRSDSFLRRFAIACCAARFRSSRRPSSPTAITCIGICWRPRGGRTLGASPEAERIAGRFDRSALVLRPHQRDGAQARRRPQIVPVYGTDFRSTPVFFLQDDHDYFDNDEATDEIVTFPPSSFMLRLARATQRHVLPRVSARCRRGRAAFPGRRRAIDGESCPKASGRSDSDACSRSLLYDVRRTETLAGPSAVFVDPRSRAVAARRARHPPR